MKNVRPATIVSKAKPELAPSHADNEHAEQLYGGPDGGWTCEVSDVRIDFEALAAIPWALCVQHRVLPIAVSEEEVILVMVDVCDTAALDAVRAVTRRRVVYGRVSEESLLRVFDRIEAWKAQ